MSTNPNNAVGTNAAYNGRTSVNAFNDVLGAFNGRGIVSGWQIAPNSGLTVSVGGQNNIRDVAIAQDPSGNRVTVNNISGTSIPVTIPAAPSVNSRVDAIVAYVEALPQGTSTDPDNPAACGLIVVSGIVASTPVAPTEAAIRTAITADGASGATAYYVVLGTVTIPNGMTTITSTEISNGDVAFVDTTLGETKNLTLMPGVTIPVTTYNGTNQILTTGSVQFAGGMYILAMPSVALSVSSEYNQARISYAIDDGEWNIICNWASWGGSSKVGSMSLSCPVQIAPGTHTLYIGFGTDSSSKRLTIEAHQTLSATLTKVGY